MSHDGWGNYTMKLELPTPADPPDDLCYIVRVPNSLLHVAAFMGAIYDLSLWWNWERDDAHTGAIVARRWRKSWYALKRVECEPVLAGPPDCEDECMVCCIECVNGVLSQKDCDGNWVPIKGCAPTGGSSSGPAPQPAPGGGQQAYDKCLDARNQWLLPTTVSTGDQINLVGFSGAWNDPDADVILWRGPQGLQYFAGAYIPGTTLLVGTDPLPTAPHMSLIAIIAGVKYSLVGGTFTVPGGISNQSVLIQANDSNIGDDQGDVCFTLNVTNNQVITWTQTLDYSQSGWGFQPARSGGTETPVAIYTFGAGWTEVQNVDGEGSTQDIIFSTVPFTATSIKFFGTCSPAANCIISDGDAHDIFTSLASASENGDFELDWTGNFTFTHGLRLDIQQPGVPAGTATIKKVVITGSGANPFA